MTIWPVIERDLRRTSRKASTWLGRLATAFAVWFVGVWLFWISRRVGGSGIGGKEVFAALTTLMIAQCLLSGASRTADCLSEEKREGTLGLLFLTDLKAWDIVLGKLFARAFTAFYGLVATFPILAISLLVGGVSKGEFWRIACNLLGTLVFSMAVGIFVSSFVERQRVAMSLSGALVLFFAPGLTAIAESLRWGLGLRLPAQVVELFSPIYTQRMAFDSAKGLSTDHFWTSLFIVQAVALSMLAGASRLLPAAFREVPRRNRPSWREQWSRRRFGRGAARVKFRKHALHVNPFYWLAGRDHFNRFGRRIFFVSLIGAIIFFETRTWMDSMALATLTILMLSLVMRVQMVSAASEHLVQERQTGTLEMLLATPISIRTILRGQWLALGRHFGAPFLGMTVIGWACLLYALQEDGASFNAAVGVLAGFHVVSIVELIALGWVGIWMALRINEPTHASGAAFWRVILVPFLLLGAIMTGFLAVSSLTHHDDSPSFRVVFCLWATLAVVNGVAWSIWARARLYQRFRIAATDRFQPPSQPWMERLANAFSPR